MKTTILIFLVLIGIYAPAQLVTDANYSNTELIEFISGDGIFIENVTYTGASYARAKFIGDQTDLGLDSGIVITTGIATDSLVGMWSVQEGPHGPNDQQGSGYNNGFPGDTLFSTLAGSGAASYNAAYFTIDFIPSGDSIFLKYAFGSEEYPEYVCAEFNDVFGFFLSGPNPIGGDYDNFNIPLIPGTSIPVSINTVNNGSVGNNGNIVNCPPPYLSNAAYYVDNTSGDSIQYDGFTVPIEGYAPVQCGAQYTIIIGVSDILDGIFDSGVFIEAGSLRSNGANVLNSNWNGNAVPSIIEVDSTNLQDSLFTDLFIVNNSNDSLIYNIERSIIANSNSWSDFICVSNSCIDISGFPNWNSSGTITEKIPPMDSVLFRPIVYPLQDQGCSTMNYRIIDSCDFVTQEFQIQWKNGEEDCHLSFRENFKNARTILYPNPTTGIFHLMSDNPIVSILVYDMTGKLVFTETSDNISSLDLSHIPEGIYVVYLKDNQHRSSTQKLLIQK